MSKKFGKFLLFSAVAGAAAYGAYQYLQNKDTVTSSTRGDDFDDDYDDFSEDLDEDLNTSKDRSYVSLNLDKAEAFATEAFHKAKEVIADSVQQVKETVRAVTETQASPESNFTDLTDLIKETVIPDDAAEKAEEFFEEAKDTVEDISNAATENVSEAAENVSDTVEEFFDDSL